MRERGRTVVAYTGNRGGFIWAIGRPPIGRRGRGGDKGSRSLGALTGKVDCWYLKTRGARRGEKMERCEGRSGEAGGEEDEKRGGEQGEGGVATEKSSSSEEEQEAEETERGVETEREGRGEEKREK